MKNNKKYEMMYEKLRENSIGPEKRCLDKRKKVILNSSVAAITLIFTLTCFVGINKPIEKVASKNLDTRDKVSSISNIDYISGYRVYDVKTYSKLRVNDLFLQYNYIDYKVDNNKRVYNYTFSDYSEVKELDESYIYGIYNFADSKTIDEVCISLGYSNFQDYLMKKGYVDELGNVDLIKWENEELIKMANYMSELMKKGNTK